MIKNISFVFLLLLVTIWDLAAQPEKPFFYKLSSDYGLPSDKTTCVLQDYQGYIWIGTEGGLSKFTGLGRTNVKWFTNYQSNPSDSNSIISDFITTLHQDPHRNLWVGTSNGICRYNFEKENFERFSEKFQEFSNRPINAIESFEGKLWIASGPTLAGYNQEKNGEPTHFKVPLDAKKEDLFHINVLKNHGEKLWIGTSMGLFSLKQGTLVPVDISGNYEITSLDIDSSGEMFIGTRNNGVLIYQNSGRLIKKLTHTQTRGFSSDQINDIKVLADQSVWVASKAGINVLSKEDRSVFRTYQYDFNNWFGLSDIEIRSIYQDKTGGVWLTTPLGGITRYHPVDNLFGYYSQNTDKAHSNELMDYSVLSTLADDKEQKLWIGSRKGLSLFDIKKQAFEHFPFKKEDKQFSNQIFDIAKGANNQLWLATENGLLVWNIRTRQYSEAGTFHLTSPINTIFYDDQHQLWVGEKRSGLMKVDIQNKISSKIPLLEQEDSESKLFEGVNDIVQQPDGTIWIASTTGLYYMEENRPVKYAPEKLGQSTTWINDLTLLADGSLIAGTKNQGVLKIDPNKNLSVVANKGCGLPSNNIASIVPEEKSDVLWASGDKGISKLIPASNEKYTVENYYIYEGLQGTQFTPKAGEKVGDQIFFGGLSGLTVFDPEEVSLPKYPLQLVFFKFFLDDKEIKPEDEYEFLKKSISVTDSIIMQPDQENFTVMFQGIDYLRSDSLVYQYKLENYDKDWLESTTNIAGYTNLEKDKHFTFRVRAKSRLRGWSEEKVLHIYTIPHYYQQWWFKVLGAMTGIGFLGLLFYIREQRSKRRERQLERLVIKRTREIRNQVRETQKTAKELEIMADNARKADKAKSEFLAKISHEMRTPLNGIMGLSQMAKEQQSQHEKNQLIDLIYQSSRSLKGIINDLLDFGKMEFEKMEIYEEPLDLRKLMEELVGSFQPQVNEKEIKIAYQIDQEVPQRLLGDLLRLRQILVNLISNAIKFTDQGSVNISAELLSSDSDSTTIEFTVSDTGIGIPESQREQIFSSFEQIDNSLTRQYEGTGLGLTISQRLANLMGGEISVQSKEGGGSKFIFELTFKKDRSSEITPTDTGRSVVAGKRVLLVEDNPINIMVATKMLEKAQQKVETASNGKEAIAKLKTSEYDIVFMDIQMPVMDGFEATEEIRKADASYANIPIVALTAGVMKDDEQRCLEIGMNDFLSKPVDYSDMENILEKYLGMSESNKV